MTQLLAVDEQLDQRCELLSNLYLCIGWHSLRSRISRSAGVVNCFQICIFVSDDTACSCDISIPCLLWIAFKFVSLYRMTQPSSRVHRGKIGCELLSNLYLCIGWHSLYIIYVICVTVVNCFQICIFVSDDTAASRWCLYPSELWIAFKFVSLYRMTQRASPVHVRLICMSYDCCELLSNLYLCIGWHSYLLHSALPALVVNCFQICIFVSDDTAHITKINCIFKLWIAFKFVSLYRMTQHLHASLRRLVGCELLSNLYLCIGWHSLSSLIAMSLQVVNCFQICIFVSDDTAYGLQGINTDKLWIAFKFVSLYRMTQPAWEPEHAINCCELLSNLYLCIGWHSKCFCSCSRTRVVNCFQICIFVSDDTAHQRPLCRPCRLWIAFKFVSLYRMTQQMIGSLTRYFGCELLSNLYLCIGWHSSAISDIMINSVVNCFQICIFVSDDTAVEDETGSWSVLWIAFKFVSLYRMTQLASRMNWQ